MIYSHMIFLLFVVLVYSTSFAAKISTLTPIGKTSTTLSSILTIDADTTANILKHSRLLEDENKNNGNNQYEFLKKYSIKFQKCFSIPMLSDRENHDQRRKLEDGDQQKNDHAKKMYSQHLVHFRLCEYDGCSDSHKEGCRDRYGDYIVDMQTFLEGYMTVLSSDRENLCENIAYRCECGNDDDDDENKNNQNDYRCKFMCFAKYDLNYCLEYLNTKNYEEKYGRDEYGVFLDEFDGSCKEFGGNDNDEQKNERKLRNDMNGDLFIGPYCSDDGGQILMGVFSDDSCSEFADDNNGRFSYKFITGKDIPYGSYSLVNNTCQKCFGAQRFTDEEENDGNAFEKFSETYEKAAKCENKMNIANPIDTECTYIHGLDMLIKRLQGKLKKGSLKATIFLAFMMILCFLVGSYAYFLKHKLYEVNHGVTLM